MAKAKSIRVRLARVANRPLQMWYTCPRTGKQIRRSAGTTNLKSADQEREKWEAELRLGIQTTGKGKPAHAHMTWELFRHEYTEVKLSTLRIKSALDAESRLDICAAIVKPTTLADMVDAGTLHRLQTKLLDGARVVMVGRAPRRRCVVTCGPCWRRCDGRSAKVGLTMFPASTRWKATAPMT